MLTSDLRLVSIDDKIYTAFAWLGYGTMLRRSVAVEFLGLLDELGLSEDERQMADNYFTLLGNQVPERWFDRGIPLGGGQPFTVGSEGEERNNRHIVSEYYFSEVFDLIICVSSVLPGYWIRSFLQTILPALCRHTDLDP